MTRGRVVGALVMLRALVACGGGSSVDSSSDAGVATDAQSSAVACEAPANDAGPSACSLSMPVQGGLTDTLNAKQACGSDTGTKAPYLAWTSTTSSGPVTVIAHLATKLPDDPLGTFVLDDLEIIEGKACALCTSQVDGGTKSWKTPSGSCSIDITSSVCAPTVGSKSRRFLSGNGKCSAPAAPEPGNDGPAITISDFELVASWAP